MRQLQPDSRCYSAGGPRARQLSSTSRGNMPTRDSKGDCLSSACHGGPAYAVAEMAPTHQRLQGVEYNGPLVHFAGLCCSQHAILCYAVFKSVTPRGDSGLYSCVMSSKDVRCVAERNRAYPARASRHVMMRTKLSCAAERCASVALLSSSETCAAACLVRHTAGRGPPTHTHARTHSVRVEGNARASGTAQSPRSTSLV